MLMFPMDGLITITLLSMILAFGMSLVQLLRGLRTQKVHREQHHD